MKFFGIAFAALAVALGFGQSAWAAPGDILFSDTFDAGPVACSALATNWTTTSTTLSGVGTFTANSNSCALFTRGSAVSVTSAVFDLSGVTGARFDAWVRKGADIFSEDPEGVENLEIEYLTAGGLWISFFTFSATTIVDGGVTTISEEVPFGALHSAAQFRVRQTGGSGGPPANGGLGFDFWHIDDVVLTETATAPPSPDLTANSCDDFENGFINWTTTNGTRAGVSGVTFNSASNSMFIRHGAVTVTSIPINTSSLTEITIWVQRGSDAILGSENPEAGENLTLQYLNSSNGWTTLETFTGSGAQGQVFNRTYAATADFRHANFQMRLLYPTGSGVDFDYWHLDDVCFVSATPDIQVSKSVAIESDPVNATTNPYGIPGSFALYTLTVINNGAGGVDVDTLSVADALDPNTTFFAGNLNGLGSPFIFTDGADASGLTLNFISLASTTDDAVFLDASNASITPAAGFDADVTLFQLDLSGAFNGASGGATPSFTIQYRVRVD